MNVEVARQHLLENVGNSVQYGNRMVTTKDFGNGVILFECEDSSGFYLPMPLESALVFLGHGINRDCYVFEGEFVNVDTGEIVERKVTVEEGVCENVGHAFALASLKLYNLAAENECMSFVRAIE